MYLQWEKESLTIFGLNDDERFSKMMKGYTERCAIWV